MTIRTKIKDSSNTWRDINSIYVKNNNSWVETKVVYVKSGSDWKVVHARHYDFTISSSFNFDLRAALTSAGWDPAVPHITTVNVAPGSVIGSRSGDFAPAFYIADPNRYAFDTGITSYPAGSSLKINVGSGAYIAGHGGNGGMAIRGATTWATYAGDLSGNLAYDGVTNGAYHGGAGCPALRVNLPTTINNAGVIAGGGGGGGTGRERDSGFKFAYVGAGGGGGAGADPGLWDQYNGWNTGAGSSQPGAATLTAGAVSNQYGSDANNRFGWGGDLGQDGHAGQYGTSDDNGNQIMWGWGGGAAGKSIVGISNVSFEVQGTLLGPTA